MIKLYSTIIAVALLSGCSLFKPPPPVLVDVPVETTGDVYNPAYPMDKASQDAAWTKHATECNLVAQDTNTSPNDCLKLKGWKNIK